VPGPATATAVVASYERLWNAHTEAITDNRHCSDLDTAADRSIGHPLRLILDELVDRWIHAIVDNEIMNWVSNMCYVVFRTEKPPKSCSDRKLKCVQAGRKLSEHSSHR